MTQSLDNSQNLDARSASATHDWKLQTDESDRKNPSVQNRVNPVGPAAMNAKTPQRAIKLATGRKTVLKTRPASRMSGWRYSVSAHVEMT
jgi:hypothetical protein